MFKLNTQSGMLHKEGHGGDSNTEEFSRADAADLAMHDKGKKMVMCKVCFADSRNTATEEVETPSASPSEFTTPAGTTPPTLVTGTSSNPRP